VCIVASAYIINGRPTDRDDDDNDDYDDDDDDADDDNNNSNNGIDYYGWFIQQSYVYSGIHFLTVKESIAYFKNLC